MLHTVSNNNNNHDLSSFTVKVWTLFGCWSGWTKVYESPSVTLPFSLCPQAPVNGDTPPAEGLSENDSGVELTNENSPLTAAEPPSPFSPKQNGDAASPQGSNSIHGVLAQCRRFLERPMQSGIDYRKNGDSVQLVVFQSIISRGISII